MKPFVENQSSFVKLFEHCRKDLITTDTNGCSNNGEDDGRSTFIYKRSDTFARNLIRRKLTQKTLQHHFYKVSGVDVEEGAEQYALIGLWRKNADKMICYH